MEEEKDKRIRSLEEEVALLKAQNQELDETVRWMHELIWKMLKKEKREEK